MWALGSGCVYGVVHVCVTIQMCGFLYLQGGLGFFCGILEVVGALPKTWMVEFFGDHFYVPSETDAPNVPLFLNFFLLDVRR